ncbi:MAG: hypothetical protein ACYTFQ_15300 [Planctomycetota bacterium]
MRRSTKIYASVLLIVCILAIVGYFALWAGRSIRVYDDDFEILQCSISRGTRHIVYSGNQTVNRIRDKLSNQFGLKFLRSSSPMRMIATPECLVLLVRYRGDLPFEELYGLGAILTDGKDISIELKGINSYDTNEQVFMPLYLIPRWPVTDDSMRVDFYLSSDYDKPVATWKVGKLLKQNDDF